MDGLRSPKSKFVTTAISYANGPPHIGHAYEFIIADGFTRFYEIKGNNVFFLTGMDEHGQKIQKTAESSKQTPKELCDKMSILFKKLDSDLHVSYSRFIRTTEEAHREAVYNMFAVCLENGDIYLGEYEGWYNTREETFITEFEASQTDYKDPTTQTPYTKMKEPSYFFRLSKYHDAIVEHIEKNPNFIVGPNDITHRLSERPLIDISISRTTIEWGIHLPITPTGEGESLLHVFYVWFDALVNYISGCPQGMWPPDIQIIGKDIVWFHAVIWIGMLMSAKLSLPKQLFVHSFINDKDGKKMSKSVGNVVSPPDLISKYPACAIRYYLLKENMLSDINFCENSLVRCHDSDLLGNLGNLVHRTFSMFHRYCKSIVPLKKAKPIFDIQLLEDECSEYISSVQFHLYIEKVFGIFIMLNTYVNTTQIWNIGKPVDKTGRTNSDRDEVLVTLLESLFIMGHFLYPIIPSIADRIVLEFFQRNEYKTLNTLSWSNLCCDTKLEKKDTILFTILDKNAYDGRKQKIIAKK